MRVTVAPGWEPSGLEVSILSARKFVKVTRVNQAASEQTTISDHCQVMSCTIFPVVIVAFGVSSGHQLRLNPFKQLESV